MIKVGYLADENTHYLKPDVRAAMLGHAGVEYYRASTLAYEHQWKQDSLPFFFFLLPTMHQTIELVAKGIAYKAIPNFNPILYSHRTLKLLKAYKNDIPSFAVILQVPSNIELLKQLEISYLGKRYGECYFNYDEAVWLGYTAVTQVLFDDLRARIGLRFPLAHTIGA